MTKTYPYETGCYVDGHWGNYALSRMLTIADDILGTDFYAQADKAWHETPEIVYNPETGQYEDGPKPDPSDTWDGFTFELLHEIADEAETALNAHAYNAVGATVLWHWHDGEFFLSPWCGDDDDCTDDDCACRVF